MAHHAEPMDVDDVGEFDNKENSFHHNNVSRATEKGYEELDVSELNMKLRYSFTPASSPMSKSYTANCLDNKSLEYDDLNNTAIENNLSQSFNSTITKGDAFVKSPKSLPLQALPSEHFADGSRNSSVLRPLDGTVTVENYDSNVTVTVTRAHDSDENISLPSTSSSPPCTPEATTPVKEVLKPGGSPILRGLKNVLNMFRPSQSPIPTDEIDGINITQEILSPTEGNENTLNVKPDAVLASTPLAATIRQKEKSSPMKESLVFNDDLEKELRWKEETTIIFSKEKIPIHKLFFQDARPPPPTVPGNSNATFSSGQDSMTAQFDGKMDTSVEPMDISLNDSVLKDKIITDTHTDADLFQPHNEINDTTMCTEKDESVFLDCETTFSRSESQLSNTTEYNPPVDENTNTKELENSNSTINLSNVTVTNVKLGEDLTKLEDTISLKSALDETPKKPFTVAEYIVANKPVTSEDLPLETTQKTDDPHQSKFLTFADDQLKCSEHQDTNPQNNILDQTVNVQESITVVASDKISTIINSTVKNNTIVSPNDLPTLPSDDEFDDAQVKIGTDNILKKSTLHEHMTSKIGFTPSVPNVTDQYGVNTKQHIEKMPQIDSQDLEDPSITVDISKESTETEITSAINLASPHTVIDIIETELTSQSSPKEDVYNKECLNSTVDVISNISDVIAEMSESKKDVDNNITTSLHTADDDIQKQEVIKNSLSSTDHKKDIINSETFKVISESETLMNVQKLESPSIEYNILEHSKIVAEVLKDTIKIEESHLNNTQEIIPNVTQCADARVVANEIQSVNEIKVPHAENIDKPDPTLDIDIENLQEELILSENNSPYVSLSAQNENVLIADYKLEDITIASKIETSSSPPICSKGYSINVENKLENTSEISQFEEISMVENPERSSSPPICSKGYNINFDDIENPFVSKTKVRLSPPPGVSLDQNFGSTNKPDVNTSQLCSENTKHVQVMNTVQPNQADISETQKEVTSNIVMKNLPSEDDDNTTLKPVLNIEKTVKTAVQLDTPQRNDSISGNAQEQDTMSKNIRDDNKTISIGDATISQITEICDTNDKSEEVESKLVKETESFSLASSLDTIAKNTSSSEQSAYYSAGVSSSETTEQTSSYDLPDFDDNNVNPFVTNSKMRASPVTVSDDNPFTSKNKIASSPVTSCIHENTKPASKESTHTVEVKATVDSKLPIDDLNLSMSKDITQNINSSTCSESSKATEEKDTTVREVHTEDEETMEGPFIEAHLESDTGKSCDIESEKVEFNDFTDLPVQESDENFEGGEMFIDADAFDFLMNQNKSSEVGDHGKESLFLKFDPLFAKRVNSDGIVDALSKIKRRQSTPKKMRPPPPPQDLMCLDKSPTAGPSNATFAGEDLSTDRTEDYSVTVQKPTMAVPPAVNPDVTPRKKATTPTRTTNRLSMNFTSPAMAVIDKLLSLSGSHSPDNRDNALPQMTREHQESDRALMQLRELLAEKELNVHHLRCESKELKERLGVLETQMTTLEKANEKRLENIKDLNEKLAEKNQININMSEVVEEYEKTIAGLIAGIEEDKKRHAEERMQLIKDRDEQTAHLASMENAFSDLHSKYEKCKQIILSYKAKEDTYRNSIKEFEENLLKMQNNYELLKQHATSKLNHANTELEKINRSHESEVLKLNAMMKRKDLHISSLEETLAQKTKANEELTAICDELINKVG